MYICTYVHIDVCAKSVCIVYLMFQNLDLQKTIENPGTKQRSDKNKSVSYGCLENKVLENKVIPLDKTYKPVNL